MADTGARERLSREAADAADANHGDVRVAQLPDAFRAQQHLSPFLPVFHNGDKDTK